VARQQEGFVATIAREIGLLEQRVIASDVSDPEQFLEELFRARHGLIAVRTMAALSREIFVRMASLTRFVPPEGQRWWRTLRIAPCLRRGCPSAWPLRRC
jgi:magnesium transporter